MKTKEIDWKEARADFAYLFTNTFVNHLPAWWLRKFFYKLLGMKIGRYVRIGWGTIVLYPKQISIGDRSIINEYCFLDGRGGLQINSNVSISIYSKIITASHTLNSKDFKYQTHKVIIDDYAFLGAQAIVLENSYVGVGCCIGAGAVAKGKYDSDSIYLGNPAKKLQIDNVAMNMNCISIITSDKYEK